MTEEIPQKRQLELNEAIMAGNIDIDKLSAKERAFVHASASLIREQYVIAIDALARAGNRTGKTACWQGHYWPIVKVFCEVKALLRALEK